MCAGFLRMERAGSCSFFRFQKGTKDLRAAHELVFDHFFRFDLISVPDPFGRHFDGSDGSEGDGIVQTAVQRDTAASDYILVIVFRKGEKEIPEAALTFHIHDHTVKSLVPAKEAVDLQHAFTEGEAPLLERSPEFSALTAADPDDQVVFVQKMIVEGLSAGTGRFT